MSPENLPLATPPPIQPATHPRWRVRLWWGLGLAVLALLVSLFVLTPYIRYREAHSFTDDGFVESHLTHLGAQTPGLIVRVLVEERDTVKAGQLLAEIDPEPHQRDVALAVAQRVKDESQLALTKTTWERLDQEFPRKVAAAKAELAFSEARVVQARTDLEIIRIDVENAVREAEAGVSTAKATQVKAAFDADRYEKLYRQESVPKVKWEDSVKALAAGEADVKAAEARLESARANRSKAAIAEQAITVAVSRRDKAVEELRLAEVGRLAVDEAAHNVKVMQAQVEQAKRHEATVRAQLEYCRIVAPFDGIVVKRYRNPGDNAPVGAPILSLYDPELVYVTAYLEEDRLEGISPGCRARLSVDAFSSPMSGRVVWIGQATGANFALVPRDISSGEFTKVPQRVPIRILPDRDSRWGELRPGLSVSVAIEHGPGDPEWARAEADRMRARGELGLSPLSPSSSGGRP